MTSSALKIFCLWDPRVFSGPPDFHNLTFLWSKLRPFHGCPSTGFKGSWARMTMAMERVEKGTGCMTNCPEPKESSFLVVCDVSHLTWFGKRGSEPEHYWLYMEASLPMQMLRESSNWMNVKFTGGGEGYPKWVRTPDSDSLVDVRMKHCFNWAKYPHFQTRSIASAGCRSI